MIFDSRLEVADAATLSTAGAGTYTLTNAIDTGSVSRDLGNGEPLYLVITVDTDITSGGTATLYYSLVSAATGTLTSSPTIHASTATVTVPASANVATLTKAGSLVWVLEMPQGQTYKQYIGVNYTVATAALTAGKVNAFFTKDPTGYINYAAVSQ